MYYDNQGRQLAPEQEFLSKEEHLSYVRATYQADERREYGWLLGRIAMYVVCALIVIVLLFRH